MNQSVRLIGIGGISQSGKSTLAISLAEELRRGNRTVEIFDMDQFVLPQGQIPKIKDRTDWELPESIDWKKLNESVEKCQSEIILIEGIFVFCKKAEIFLFDFKILIEADREAFFSRRAESTRWGSEPAWYLNHVWESNQRLVAEAKPDLVLRGSQSMDVQGILESIGLA